MQLIVVHEYRAMLKKGSVATPLCTADELTSMKSDLANRWMMKAGDEAWMRRLGAAPASLHGMTHDLDSINAKADESSDQETIDSFVRFAEIAGIVNRCGDGIRDLSVVENSSATSWPTDDVDVLLRKPR